MPTLRILGEANLKQSSEQFAVLTQQVEALNRAMAKSAMIPAGGTPAGYTKTTAALGAASRAYNEALASSGAFRVENLKVNDVIAQQTDLLRRQKLGYKDIWGSKAARTRMQAIRREQVAMQRMTVRAVEGGIGDGSLRANLAIPKDVSKSWDTLRSKVGMFRYELSSASKVLLNWGKNTQWAGRQLMAGITYPVAAFGAAAGVMAYQVDKQFTRVRKVYDTTANQFSHSVDEQMAAQKELDKVRTDGMKTAMNAAKEYGASITDTISVQADLAATGQRGAALQAATTEVVKNAMLGEIDYQTTTKATIALQQQLHLSSTQLADSWAYMNDVENQTSLGMADFAEAIPVALGPIQQMGGNLQDLGTLMTAMVSRGVQVGKAANAIKALPQRLSRPSKQVQEEFKMLTGQDIMELNAKNPNNILGLLESIYDATKNLDTLSRRKVLAGLFGSFQLSNMNALLQGMGDLENGVGQVTTAYEIGGAGAKEWGRVQRQEIEAFQKSASGRFKIALQTIKASLAEVGQPFLEVASTFLSVTTKIIDAFNKLPSVFKKVLIGGAIFAALTGPVIMLVGLFANFAANMGLTFAGVLKLIKGFDLFNKAEWAQIKLDELYQKGLYTTSTALAEQTKEIGALTLAMKAHNAEMMKSMGPKFGANEPFFMGGITPAPQTKQNVAALMNNMYNPGTQRYQDPDTGKMIKQVVAQRKAEEMLASQIMTEQGLIARNATAEEQAVAATNRIRASSSRLMSGQNVMMGAMVASSATMLLTENKTLNTMSQLGMMLALGVPAVKGLAVGLTAASTQAFKVAKGVKEAQMASLAATAQTAKLARLSGTVRAGFAGAGAGLVEMLGPVGIVAAVVGTIGFGIYKWHQHEVGITKEKREQANAMYQQNQLLADQLEISEKQKKTLFTASGSEVAGLPSATDLAGEMQTNKTYKPLIDDLTDKNTMQAEKDAIALQKYREVLTSTGGTAQKASLYLQAMFIAAGDGALEAQRKAADYANQIGSTFGNEDLTALWSNQIASIFNDTDTDSIIEQGTNVGKDLADAIAQGGKENAPQTLQQFVGAYNAQMPAAFAELTDTAKKQLAQLGVDTTEEINQLLSQWKAAKPEDQPDLLSGLGVSADNMFQYTQLLNGLVQGGGPMEKYLAFQQGAVKELADQLGIEEKITTFKQLQATWEWKLATATQQNAKSLYQDRVKQEEDTYNKTLSRFGIEMKLTDVQKLYVANQVLANAGLGKATTLSQAIAMLSGTWKVNTAETADNIDTINNKMSQIKFSDDDMKNILKTSMSGVESDLADAAGEAFDKRMNSALDAAQKGWDKKSDELNNRQDAQMDKFEKRWDRRKAKVTSAYDAQIKGIEKTIDAEAKAEDLRQKMFDAEMTRIERLKDAANQNIDLQVAVRTGDLDQAAKIQNDMIAQSQGWALSDAAAASGDTSQARTDRLNKQKDSIEEAKDKRLKAMDAEEEAQKKHLDKMQDAQDKALKNQTDAAMDALHDQWDAEKANLNDRLDLFQTYTARNKKDLDRWLKEVGLSYDDFGGSLMFKGESWSGGIEKSLKKHIRAAGMDIANSQLWEQWGAGEAKKTLQGMGFGGMGQFKKFIMTGKLPNGFGKSRHQGSNDPAPPHIQTPGGEQFYHTGGMVGRDKGGRKGVARTSGLHPSEQPIIAQKGEYIVNRRSAAKYGPTLEAMNSGKSMGSIGTPAFAAATAMRGLVSGVSRALSNAFVNKSQQMAASSAGTFTAGQVANYGGRDYGSVQLKNAATIANVGASRFAGANAARAIEIGIMTAITESGLNNVNYGDRDSLGLFQQRASWGSVAERMDPTIAAGKFFDALKHVSGWQNMSPWMAAQSVQRSAFSDGSNYRPNWDDALGIYSKGIIQANGQYVAGMGGAHKPIDANISGGIHDAYTGFPAVDAAASVGHKVYAVGDGLVTRSEDIKGPLPSDKHRGDGPYGSYGRVIQLLLTGGDEVLYAHLSQRSVNKGQKVPGGSVIGYSGNTGNSSGPHLHFGSTDGKPEAFWGFRGGGYTVKDTPAVIHSDEMVIDKTRTKKMYGLVDSFANGDMWTWFSGFNGKLGPNGMPVPPDALKTQTPATGGGDTVRTGTYNVKFDTPNDKTQGDLNKLFGMTDILALTEWAENKRALNQWVGTKGWGIVDPGPARNDAAVAYNKSKFDLVRSTVQQMNNLMGVSLSGARGAGGSGAMYATGALLKAKDSGVSLWQIAAHTIAHLWKSSVNRQVQQQQFGALGTMASNLGNKGKYPVFVGGDLNNDPRAIGNDHGAQGAKWFAPLVAAGLKDNWNKDNMKGNFTMGDRYIDHMFSNSLAKYMNQKVIGGLASDHKAVLTEFQIPQLSKGAQNIRWDNTLANLHKGEGVLTEDLNTKFKQGVDNFANGGQPTYNTIVNLNGANMDPKEVAFEVDKIQRRRAGRRPTVRSNR